jgi:hypothetical protein
MLKIVQDVQVVQPLRSVQIVERTERFKTLRGFQVPKVEAIAV